MRQRQARKRPPFVCSRYNVGRNTLRATDDECDLLDTAVFPALNLRGQLLRCPLDAVWIQQDRLGGRTKSVCDASRLLIDARLPVRTSLLPQFRDFIANKMRKPLSIVIDKSPKPGIARLPGPDNSQTHELSKIKAVIQLLTNPFNTGLDHDSLLKELTLSALSSGGNSTRLDSRQSLSRS
jgi:hypothetical protein